jgi:hypothetical protein
VRSELRGGIKSFRLGQHRIYYAAIAERVKVVRVLHVAMDVVSHVGRTVKSNPYSSLGFGMIFETLWIA